MGGMGIGRKKILSACGAIILVNMCLATAAPAFAQNAADTAFIAEARKNAYLIYKSAIGDQSNLHNGSEYKEYQDNANTKGIRSFLTDDWTDGSVYYDSAHYANVGLLYDIVTDKLILDQPFS